MSEMVRNKGVIKELYPELSTFGEKVAAFADQQGVPIDEVAKNYYEDEWDIVDYHNFAKIGEKFFDISDAPDDSDSNEEVEHIRRLNATDYEIDLYYYNGGTCMEEIVEDWMSKNPDMPKEASVFYAVKMTALGRYWTRDSSPTPALFLTENKARATVLKHTAQTEDEIEIVRFVEQ